MSTTREGFQWTEASGLQPGLQCKGVIEPPQRIVAAVDVFDVVIIGAGYTGLTAARDLTALGLNILILEGRDRIGGRTWTADVDGYRFEMGGSWVHWFQPHVYRELSRYGMKSDLEACPDHSRKCNYFNLVTPHGRRQMSHEDEAALLAGAVHKFVNVDDNRGKTVMPFPFDSHRNPQILRYANMSLADRIEQIKDNLSEDERHMLEAIFLVCSGGTRENSAFLDFLRWWAAGGHDLETFMDTVIGFKLKCGQSGFAKHFFDEAQETGNLSYSFSTSVSAVDGMSDNVSITVADGSIYKAKRVVCTVPLNVLNKVSFQPPLSRAKQDAAALRHVNQIVKIHAEVRDPEMRSWGGVTYPHNKLLMGSADGTTPAGKTHIVFFGCHQNHMHVDEDIDGALRAIQVFAPMDVDRLVFHNWSKDEFAEGAWVWYRPGMEVEYLDALRERQGNVLFANSDWAEGGWRSFIDGAIQAGTEAALVVKNELLGRKNSPAKALVNRPNL